MNIYSQYLPFLEFKMIRVKSIMTRNVISVPLSSSLKEAANLMLSKSVSCLLVVDENKPVGVLSESNIIKGAVAKKAKVKDIMSRNFIVISPKTKFSEISKALRERKIKIFPVIENGSLAGLVAETDIIQATRDF